MEAAAVDFYAQNFLQPDITEVHLSTEVVQEGKLAGLVGSFEHYRVQAKRFSKTIGESGIEISCFAEQSHALSALSCFHDQLEGTSIEPSVPLLNQVTDGVFRESSGMLLP